MSNQICAACAANNARMAIDIEHTCGLGKEGETVSEDKDKAPERVFLRACYPESPNRHCSWDVDKNREGSVEYVRADLTALTSARKEERAAIKATFEDYFKHFFCTCHGSTRTGGHFASCPVTIRDEVLGRIAALDRAAERRGGGGDDG